MKRISLVALFVSFVFSAFADSNLIAGKEIWEPGESTAPSAVGDYDDDDDDDDYYSQKGQKNWPNPKAQDQNPSMFTPKGSKDVFPAEE